MPILTSLLAGLVFGLGLIVSGMFNPAKVQVRGVFEEVGLPLGDKRRRSRGVDGSRFGLYDLVVEV